MSENKEDNNKAIAMPEEPSLIELKAVWYDLLVQKQQIENQMNNVNNLIAQRLEKESIKK